MRGLKNKYVDRGVRLGGLRFHYRDWGQSGNPPIVVLQDLVMTRRIGMWWHRLSRMPGACSSWINGEAVRASGQWSTPSLIYTMTSGPL